MKNLAWSNNASQTTWTTQVTIWHRNKQRQRPAPTFYNPKTSRDHFVQRLELENTCNDGTAAHRRRDKHLHRKHSFLFLSVSFQRLECVITDLCSEFPTCLIYIVRLQPNIFSNVFVDLLSVTKRTNFSIAFHKDIKREKTRIHLTSKKQIDHVVLQLIMIVRHKQTQEEEIFCMHTWSDLFPADMQTWSFRIW